MKLKLMFLLATLVIAMLLLSNTATMPLQTPGTESEQENEEEITDEYLEPEPEEELVILVLTEKNAKPEKPPKPPKDEEPVCYKSFTFWREDTSPLSIPLSVSVNPAGSNLDPTAAVSTIATSGNTWDVASAKDLFLSFEYDGTAAAGYRDNSIEISFGDYPSDGVIAVAYCWYVSVGKPSSRYMLEFDIMFDTDYEWSLNGEALKMDLQNIATHELGHGLGLDDLYESTCTEETMYGYAGYAETKKRDLNDGDLAGLQSLYGVP